MKCQSRLHKTSRPLQLSKFEDQNQILENLLTLLDEVLHKHFIPPKVLVDP